jgi:hypothetical protein
MYVFFVKRTKRVFFDTRQMEEKRKFVSSDKF